MKRISKWTWPFGKSKVTQALALAAAMTCCSHLDAATRSWLDSSGGVFSDTSNWSGSAVPGTADDASFNLSSTYAVSLLTNPTNLRLLVDSDAVTLNLGSHTYNLTSSASSSLVVGSTGKILAGNGFLSINSGTLSGIDAQIGVSGLPANGGTLVVGGGGNLIMQTMSIGAGRSGTLNIQSGGHGSSTFSATIGDQSTGHAIVSGFNATWAIGAALDIGSGAAGELDVYSGGAVTGTVPATLGYPSGIVGTANIITSRWSMRDLIVGGLGSGALHLSSAGTVNVTGTGSFVTSVGDQIGGSGIITVDGASSRLTLSSGQFKIGNFGNGQLQITNGGVAVSGQSFIGYTALGAGTASISGPGSAWATSSLYVGGGTSTAGGSGLLTIGPGGTFENNNTGIVKIWSTGTVQLNGGTLQTGSLQIAGGAFNWSTGTVHITNSTVSINSGGMLGSNVALGAGQALIVPELHVADTGLATIAVNGGATLNSFTSMIGGSSFSSGSVLVSGAGSNWNANSLTIGIGGNAFMSITGGARVDSAFFSGGPCDLAQQSTSTARVVVDGVGSIWNAPSDNAQPGDLHIGENGQATLQISNGGVVVNDFGFVELGNQSASGGTALLSGGASWSVGRDVTVGYAGNGFLSITGASSATDANADSAVLPSATAVIQVNGSGSTWNHAGQVVIGHGGTASLTIGGGASVTASDSYVGLSIGSNGHAAVQDLGSTWTSNGSMGLLDVGGAGTGSLGVLNGAHASSNETIIGDGSTGVGTVIVDGSGSTLVAPELAVGFFGHGSLLISNGGIVTTSEAFVPVNSAATGYMQIDGAGSRFSSSSLSIGTNGRVHYNGGSLIAGALHLTGAAQLLLSPGADKVVQTTSLSIDVPGGSRVDLADNDMIIDYTGPVGTQVSDIRNDLRTAALRSSSGTATTRLGYGDNAVLAKTTFAGKSVDSSSILIKYTYSGDADLDGDADGVDIGTWATNFTGELGGLGSSVWTQGDWDYDGDVDGVDAGLWAQAFTGELGGGGLGSLVVDDPTIAPGAAAILRGMGITVVPEPASIGLLLTASLLLRRRRCNQP